VVRAFKATIGPIRVADLRGLPIRYERDVAVHDVGGFVM